MHENSVNDKNPSSHMDYLSIHTKEWISVKDRLPNKLQKVLFYWLMGYRCDDGWNIYLPYHSFGLRDDICPVTHWTELPDYPETSLTIIPEKKLTPYDSK